MSPRAPGVLFSEYFWNLFPFYISSQVADGLKGIHPRRVWSLEKRDQRIRKEG